MKRMILFALFAFLSMAQCACQGSESDQNVVTEPNDMPGAIINGEPIYYLDETDLNGLEKPLAKLLANIILPYGERGEIMGEAPIDPNSPAVPLSYSCGLCDINNDGFPDLLIHPFGYYGSSGTVTYYAYDIFSGQKLGQINSGNYELWAEYYSVNSGECFLFGRYWLRYGWEEQEHFIVTPVYSEEHEEYFASSIFRTYHQIVGEEIETEDDDPNDMYHTGIWEENYPNTEYYVSGKHATLDDYYDAYYEYTETYVLLPETQLILLRWDAVSDDKDDYTERAEKMAKSLLKTGQKFIARSKRTHDDALKGGQP